MTTPKRPPRTTRHAPWRRALAAWLAGLLLGGFAPGAALAGPQGEQVVNGQVEFVRQGDTTVIRASDGSIIDYQSFDVLRHETVQFLQPDAASRVLNRIQAATPTQIDGALLANGRVYLVNPAGIFIGRDAVVNVAALYAAAGAISNEDFLARIDRFTDLQGKVVNLGSITGDVVSLVGRNVENAGSITARDGLVALVAGDEVVLLPVGESVRVRLASGASATDVAEAGVTNAGAIDAGDGVVDMAAGDLYSLAIRQEETGSVRAKDIALEGGEGGAVEVSGTLDASDATGAGGRVRVLGDRVALAGATIDASGATGGGEVLVGGNFQGKGPERNASTTTVGADAHLAADATQNGDGGKVIVWSDGTTRFHGRIDARGGAQGGDGGFAEVSGKSALAYDGVADLGASAGRTGTLLLDPENIRVTNTAAGTGGSDGSLPSVTVGPPPPGGAATVSRGSLELQNANISLTATNDVTIDPLAGDLGGTSLPNTLNLRAGLTVRADSDASGAGIFDMTTTDTIRAAGQDVDITGAGVRTGNIDTSGAAPGQAGGSVTLTATATAGGIVLAQQITTKGAAGAGATDGGEGGDVTLTSGSGTLAVTVAGVDASGGANPTGTGGAGGTVTMQGAGATAAPVSLFGDVTSKGGTGATPGADGDQTYRGLATLAGTPRLFSGGAIRLAGGLDAVGLVTLDGSGTKTLGGTVTAGSLRSQGAGATAIDATTLTTTTEQTYDTAVTVGAGGHVFDGNAGTLTFNQALSGAGDVTLDASGATTLNGTVDVANLRSTGGGTTVVNTVTVTTNGDQTYDDTVTVDAGPHDFVAGAGTVTFAQPLVAPGSNLTISGGSVETAAIDTRGAADQAGGEVRITATDAAGTGVETGALTTTGGAGVTLSRDGGAIRVTSARTIETGPITTTGGAGAGPIAGGKGGDVTLTSGGATRAIEVTGGGIDAAGGANATGAGGAGGAILMEGASGTAAPVSLFGDATTVGGAGATAPQDGADADQTYRGRVTLAGTPRTFSGAALTLAGGIDAPGAVLVDGSGVKTLGGIVSADALTSQGAGATVVDATLIETSTQQTYDTPVTLGAGSHTFDGNAGTITFNQTLSGAGGATLDAGGLTTLAADVGVASLVSNGGGTTTVRSNVTTTGAQTYTDAIDVTGLAPQTFSGSAVTFSGPLNGAAATNVTAAGTSLVRLVGPVNVGRLTATGGGATEVAGNVTTATDQLYLDPVLLTGGGSKTFKGANLVFSQDVSGTGAMIVLDAGVTSFGGRVSAGSLETDAAGATMLAGDQVTTTTIQRFRDPLTLTAPGTTFSGTSIEFFDLIGGDLVVGATAGSKFTGFVSASSLLVAGGPIEVASNWMQTSGLMHFASPVTVTAPAFTSFGAGGDLLFDGTLNGGGDLYLWSNGSTRFGGNVGDLAAPLSLSTSVGPTGAIRFGGATTLVRTVNWIDLNPWGRAETPFYASIYKEAAGPLTFDSFQLYMGYREKLTVPGFLRLDVTNAWLGDLNAVHVASTATGSIVVVGRDGAATLGGMDTGTDWVANSFDFSSAASLTHIGAGDFRIGARWGGTAGEVLLPPSTAVVLSAFQQVGTEVVLPALIGAGGVIYDLQPLGPAPVDTNQQTPPPPAPIAKIELLEQMNEVAISERPLREDEVSAFLDCDADDKECQAKALGAARAESQTAEDLRARYSGLFGTPPVGSAPPTLSPKDIAPAGNPSRERLQRAVDDFRAQFGSAPGGVSFRQFLEESPEHADALAVLNDLAATFTLAREIGMTSTGLGGVKKSTLGKVAPQGMSIDELEKAVEAGGVIGEPARSASLPAPRG